MLKDDDKGLKYQLLKMFQIDPKMSQKFIKYSISLKNINYEKILIKTEVIMDQQMDYCCVYATKKKRFFI